MKPYIIIVFLTLCFALIGQNKQYNNWFFGEKVGLNFNTVPPSRIYNNSMNTWESSASISDSAGNLLFYTDGITVWNKNNIQMPNGFGLKGDVSTTQGALIVPYPGKPHLYYLFTLDNENGLDFSCGCLAYSIINMNLQGGLGDVTTKNVILFNNGVTEKLAAAKHENDTSYWVVFHEYNSLYYDSYLIDVNGINTTRIPSAGLNMYCCEPFVNSVFGQMKISPSCKKIATVHAPNKCVELADFSTKTGKITNLITIPLNITGLYGLEFSPNSRFIYLTNSILNSAVYQIDISSNDANMIANSLIQISDKDSTKQYGQLLLGPDNKIYTGRFDEQFVDIIHKPDLPGLQCNYLKWQIKISDTLYRGFNFGLPTRISDCKSIPYVATAEIQPCELIIPNVITPNGDLINDEFKLSCDDKKFIPEDLIIFNRWGKEILNEQIKLNLLNTANDGTYYYIFTYEEVKYKGFFEIFN